MDRRGFLKGLTSGAVGWLAAGSIADTLATLVPVYAAQVPFTSKAKDAGIDALFVVDPVNTAEYQASVYPQSVAAGDPNPNGCVLWTRVDPSITGPEDAIIAWQLAVDASFSRESLVLEGTAYTQAGSDNTVKLPLQHPALQPFSIYFYRFIFRGIASRTGRFKTLPRPNDKLARLRIGYTVCQDWSNGYYHAYKYLAEEEVDVVVFLGDYVYEYVSDGVGGPGGGSVRVLPPYPSGQQYPQNLADYRHLYQVYRSDPEIQATHERFAYIQLWDDHEFYNDCHQDYHEDTNTPPLTATTPQPALREAANQAWVEHGLAAVPFHPDAGWEYSVQVYRNFKFGNLADVIVTDQRLYRDGPPCGDIDIGERYETLGCAELSDPARTMLGSTQKAWFLDKVKHSTATWKIWANEVMLCQYRLPTPGAPASYFEYFDLDQWDGYPAERADLLTQIGDAGVRNFIVISGDAHLYLTSYLRPDFNDLSQPPVGIEFMVGAISSGNYLDAMVDAPTTTPLPSLPGGARRAAQLGLPLDSLAPAILAYNPHMLFWNGTTWGYAILTITPEKMICDYRVVSSVKTPTATLEQLASFTVKVDEVVVTQTA